VASEENGGSEPLDIEFPLGLEELLPEWNSTDDQEAYRDL
jgi:hypothetical protein